MTGHEFLELDADVVINVDFDAEGVNYEVYKKETDSSTRGSYKDPSLVELIKKSEEGRV